MIAGPADLIELRLDLLPDDVTVTQWIDASPRPVLVTLRSKAQGGQFRGSPSEAAARLREAAAAGAAWLDVEADVAPQLGDLPEGVGLLASVHGVPEAGATWAVGDARFLRIKIARPCDDPGAFEDLCSEARAADPRCFFVPYGRLAATRALFAHERAFLFGAAADNARGAPGQPLLRTLLDDLRGGEVTRQAALFGLVGQPPTRSPSPAIHNACFRAAGRDALYVPLADIPLSEAVGLPLQGMSVTMPDKQAAYHFADEHDEAAQATAVVNTLVRTPTGWAGHNTDVEALQAAAGTPPPETPDAFVYGAGGYARAAVHAATRAGWRVRVAARHERSALTLAEAFGVSFAGSSLYERRPGDGLVIHATPAGADGQPVPAFAAADLRGLRVLDAPYASRGLTTGLVDQARAQGAAIVIDGRALLAAQAQAQARLFASSPLPPDRLRRVVALAARDAPSWVLVGARGAGKTTVGRAVAAALGRPFVDLDAALERATGRAPAAWIEGPGWDAFRAAEHALLERTLQRRGIVIATGGGVVEHEASRALLTAHPAVVRLEVSPAVAAARVDGDATLRPRLPGALDALDEAERSQAARDGWWRAVANHSLDARESVDALVAQLVSLVTSAAS